MLTEKVVARNNCAFYTEKECRATITTCNRNIPCTFFKTMNEHQESCDAAFKRIAKIPQEQQDAISEKYYGGTKPWMEV